MADINDNTPGESGKQMPLGKADFLSNQPWWEAQIVRDVIYVCHGIDGEFLKQGDGKQKTSYLIRDENRFSSRVRYQVLKLCEIGFLYRQVHDYVAERQSAIPENRSSVIEQAFVAGIQNELSEYVHLLAILESRAHHAIPSPKLRPEITNASPTTSSFLSLSRLSLMLVEPLYRLQIIANIVEASREHTGGALTASLFQFLQSGDPLQLQIVKRLLEGCCAPLIDMIQSWVFEGYFRDPHGEFFVAEIPNCRDDDLWHNGYVLRKEMLPTFISEELGHKILRAGLTINFLRRCCKEEDWSSGGQVSWSSQLEQVQKELGSGITSTLSQMVAMASRKFDRHLMQLMVDKFHLLEHCLALRQYLLLAQGDFVQYLLDRVGSELSRPAKQVSTFQLTGILVAALNQSNMSNSDNTDIHNRLQVKLSTPGPRDRGWHVFSLEYVVSPPLTAVLTAQCMDEYRRVFSLMWRLKRVEHNLSQAWLLLRDLHREITAMARSSSLLSPLHRRFSSRQLSADVAPEAGLPSPVQAAEDHSEEEQSDEREGELILTSLVKAGFLQRKKMDHFVSSLQSYFNLEAIEACWSQFCDSAKAAASLDDFIHAHGTFLRSVTDRAMLGSGLSSLLAAMDKALDAILTMTACGLKLRAHVQAIKAKEGAATPCNSQEEHSKCFLCWVCRKEAEAKRVATRTAAGQWGTTAADGESARLSGKILEEIRREMDLCWAGFTESVKGFVALIPAEGEQGLQFQSLRFEFASFVTG